MKFKLQHAVLLSAALGGGWVAQQAANDVFFSRSEPAAELAKNETAPRSRVYRRAVTSLATAQPLAIGIVPGVMEMAKAEEEWHATPDPFAAANAETALVAAAAVDELQDEAQADYSPAEADSQRADDENGADEQSTFASQDELVAASDTAEAEAVLAGDSSFMELFQQGDSENGEEVIAADAPADRAISSENVPPIPQAKLVTTPIAEPPLVDLPALPAAPAPPPAANPPVIGPLPPVAADPPPRPFDYSPYAGHSLSSQGRGLDAVQQRAAYKAAQRTQRIEARKWAGYSPLRPAASANPFMQNGDRIVPTAVLIPFAPTTVPAEVLPPLTTTRRRP